MPKYHILGALSLLKQKGAQGNSGQAPPPNTAAASHHRAEQELLFEVNLSTLVETPKAEHFSDKNVTTAAATIVATA